MSLSLSLRHRADAQDTSEHISARSCPYLSLFDTARTHRTRASTSVLARVLYVLIPVPSAPWGHRGHERALMCSLVSLSLSLRHCADAQDTSEHISARSCPCLSLFDTARTHRTRASTLVLARVLVSLSSTPRGRTGHERAHRCSLVSLSLSHRLCADAQDTSEHIGAHSCSICPYPCPFDTMGTPRTRASTPVLASVLYVLISVSSDSQNTSEHIGAHWCSVCPYPCLF